MSQLFARGGPSTGVSASASLAQFKKHMLSVSYKLALSKSICNLPLQRLNPILLQLVDLQLPEGSSGWSEALRAPGKLVEQDFQFSSVQLLSCVQLYATPWTVACQASLSITNSRSLLKLIYIESVIPSNHLILCCPLLLPPSIFPSIRVFSSEALLPIRRPKYWNFSFSISPSNEFSGLIPFRMDCLYPLQSKGLSRIFSNTTVQKHQFFSTQLSL